VKSGAQREPPEKKSDEKCMGKPGDDGHIYLGVDGASAFSDASLSHSSPLSSDAAAATDAHIFIMHNP
jgi:hypothetical protein